MPFLQRMIAGVSCFALGLPALAAAQAAQSVPYGANPRAGAYVTVADTRLYFETYGTGGTPLVLLHGGAYGYIDEFSDLIAALQTTRTVIAIATRGYGRSERGSAKLSHRQFALDVTGMLDSIVGATRRVDLLGFSEGAITGLLVTATAPNRVRRLVAIGGSLGTYGNTLSSIEAPPLSPERMQREVPDLVQQRKRVMTRPGEWEPLIRELDAMYHVPVFVPQDEFRRIGVPTLIMGGDRDEYVRQEHFIDMRRMLAEGELSIIPGCGHVVLACKPAQVIQIVKDFLDAGRR